MPDSGKKTWDRVIDIGKYVMSAMLLPALWWGVSVNGKVQILQEKMVQTGKYRISNVKLLSERIEYLKMAVKELQNDNKTIMQNTIALTRFGEKLNGLTKVLGDLQSYLRDNRNKRSP